MKLLQELCAALVLDVAGNAFAVGETASTSQGGYILSPWQTIKIKGWRKSLKRTAAFFFTEQDNSYASRTGCPENVGVIGVALFRSGLSRTLRRIGKCYRTAKDARDAK